MDSVLDQCLTRLVRAQNPDGGWSYYTGRDSWLEPTAWALVAMHGHQAFRASWQRGWEKLVSWQRADGGSSPGGGVDISTWATALWVTAHAVAGVHNAGYHRAVDWLLEAKGTDGAFWRRMLWKLTDRGPSHNADYYGWSWFPGTHSWLEPTVHTLVALKLAGRGGHRRAQEIKDRIRIGEQMLIDRRCADGGWNYGASSALDVPLPSYPECTALAMVALQGADIARRQAVLDAARDLPASPLANAWTRVALVLHGQPVRESGERSARRDLTVEAVAALTAPGGNVGRLSTETES